MTGNICMDFEERVRIGGLWNWFRIISYDRLWYLQF
jgi:hypothetical protein